MGDVPGILNMYVRKSFVVTIMIIIKKKKRLVGVEGGKFCSGNRFDEKTKLHCTLSA